MSDFYSVNIKPKPESGWDINECDERDASYVDIDAYKKLKQEKDKQIDILQKALIESQDWNWITAQEYMEDHGLSQYPIKEMQQLYELANNNRKE